MKLKKLDYTVILAFLAYSSSAVVTPICLVLLLRELSLSMTEGGGIEAMRSVWALILLVLSGFAAARWGKTRTIGVSCIILGVGLFLYACAPNYSTVLVAMCLLGIGSGGIEGLVNPLVQDLHPEDSGRYLNLSNAFWSVGVLATVLIAGELLTHAVSWRVLVAGIGVFSLVTGILFLVFREQRTHTSITGMADTVSHAKKVLSHRSFWLFSLAMFCTGGAEGACTFWSASYIQICFNSSPRAGGIGTACFAGGMVLGRLVWGQLIRQSGLRRLIFWSALSGMFVSLALPFVSTFTWFCIVLVLAGLAMACFWPSIQSYAADVMDVDHTMLFILLSCAGIPGFGVICWVMGYIADHGGLRISFAMIPVVLLVLTITVLCIPRKGDAKQQRDGDDAYPIIEPL